MAFSARNLRSVAIAALLVGLPVVLLRSAVQEPRELGAIERGFRVIGGPLEAAIAYSAGMLGSVFERWVLQAQVQDKNSDLERENRDLRRELRELANVKSENEELRLALRMRQRVPDDMLVAERVGIDQSPLFRVVRIRLDRSQEYVRTGMAVIHHDGVVGRIDRASTTHSDVMLITDPRSRLAVEIAGNRAQGILEGLGEDRCAVRVSKDFDVKVGDLVQTSGVDELFPKGHPVGKVIAVEPMVDDRLLVEVQPAVPFDRIEVMWVVLSRAPVADPGAAAAPAPVYSHGMQPVR